MQSLSLRGKVFSLGDIAEIPKGVPSPTLITRAVQELSAFATLKIHNILPLSFMMKVKPKKVLVQVLV